MVRCKNTPILHPEAGFWRTQVQKHPLFAPRRVKGRAELSIELNDITMAMKPYIDIVDYIKAESMTKFNNYSGKPYLFGQTNIFYYICT